MRLNIDSIDCNVKLNRKARMVVCEYSNGYKSWSDDGAEHRIRVIKAKLVVT